MRLIFHETEVSRRILGSFLCRQIGEDSTARAAGCNAHVLAIVVVLHEIELTSFGQVEVICIVHYC